MTLCWHVCVECICGFPATETGSDMAESIFSRKDIPVMGKRWQLLLSSVVKAAFGQQDALQRGHLTVGPFCHLQSPFPIATLERWKEGESITAVYQSQCRVFLLSNGASFTHLSITQQLNGCLVIHLSAFALLNLVQLPLAKVCVVKQQCPTGYSVGARFPLCFAVSTGCSSTCIDCYISPRILLRVTVYYPTNVVISGTRGL